MIEAKLPQKLEDIQGLGLVSCMSPNKHGSTMMQQLS
jgi:hypothetical protein